MKRLQTEERTAGRKLLHWFYAFLFVTLLGVIFGYNTFMASLNEEESPVTLLVALSWQMGWWYLWLLLCPVILFLSRRFPVERKTNYRNIGVHLLCALLLASVQTVVHTFINWCTIKGFEGEPFAKAILFSGLADGNFQLGVIFYAVIASIASAMNFYHIYQEEELKASRLEIKLTETRFQAVKMQIYPHFLFATLRHISALMKNNSEAADKMIARLGDFLRQTMENIGNQEVTLHREMQFLKSYLEIEKIRLDDHFTFDLEVAPQASTAQIPNLILQPMAETLLKQIIEAEKSGHIRVCAERQNGTLRVQMMRESSLNWQPAISENLSDTEMRLQHLYGDDYRLERGVSDKGDVVLTLEIPFITSPD